MSQTLMHKDEVSGTTILDDGRKVHWSESGSDAVLVRQDGTTEQRFSPYELLPVQQQIDDAMNDVRPMTRAEEREWAKAMYGK